MSFLTNRADSLAKLAENHRKLEGVCIKFGLIPKSGDLMTDNWPQPVDKNGKALPYWPQTAEGSILLTKLGTFPEHVSAVRINEDGFYGHVLNVGGNHNLDTQELGWMLERTGLTPAE